MCIRDSLQDGQRVISDGPYRLVRHPMYSGTVLAWVGSALALSLIHI